MSFDHVRTPPSLHFLCRKSIIFLTTYPPLNANVICEGSFINSKINFLSKGHSTYASKIPFTRNLELPECTFKRKLYLALPWHRCELLDGLFDTLQILHSWKLKNMRSLYLSIAWLFLLPLLFSFLYISAKSYFWGVDIAKIINVKNKCFQWHTLDLHCIRLLQLDIINMNHFLHLGMMNIDQHNIFLKI